MDSNFFRPKIIVPKLYLKLEFDTEDQVLFNYVKRNNIYKLSNFAGFYKNFFLVSQTIQYNLNTMEKMELEDCILVDNGSQGSIEFKME